MSLAEASDLTGLVYYRARYYDPTLGRFTQRDPVGFDSGINLYAYVNGNPTTLTDPSGLGAFNPSYTLGMDTKLAYYNYFSPTITAGASNLQAGTKDPFEALRDAARQGYSPGAQVNMMAPGTGSETTSVATSGAFLNLRPLAR